MIVVTFLAVPFVDVIFAEKVIATVPVDGSPIGLAFNPVNNSMYVANSESNEISVIDSISHREITTIPVGLLTTVNFDSPIEFNPINNYIYVTNAGSNTVSVINSTTNTVNKTIPVGSAPHEPEFNDFDTNMYILNRGTATISVINSSTNTVTKTIAINPSNPSNTNPVDILYNPFNNHLYTANTGQGTVSVIDVISGMVITTITVESQPRDLEFNPSNNHVYVSNFGDQSVSVIDSISNTLITTLSVNSNPSDLEYNPFNKSIYVAGQGNDAPVTVIDSLDTISAEVPISQTTFALEFNEFNKNMYVSTSSDFGHNVIKVIDSASNTVIDTITVGFNPEHLRFNPTNNFIYTANRGSDSVSVIGPELETIIINASDGNGNPVVNLTSTTSNSIEINVNISNQFDVDGVICFLNGQLYEGCDQFDDPISENPEEDLKECTIEEGNIEVCRFTISIDNLPRQMNSFTIGAFEEEFEEEEPSFSAIDNEILSNKLLLSNTERENEQSNMELSLKNSKMSFGFQDNYNNNIESRTNLTSANPKLEFPLPLSLTQLIVGNLPIEVDNEIKSLNNEKKHSVPLDRNPLNVEDTLPLLDTNSYDNIDQLSFNESEKLLIQHNPETDDIVVDPTPTTLVWEVLQEEPLDTNITNATDGNEEFVENKSSTISNDINFTFIAENNTTNASFTCVLDNGPDEPCDVGFKFYGGLPSGEHTFSVNAYIPGGEGDVDTTPATWVWTVENIVVNTTLEPTFDGNGPLANRSSTTSNEIHFKFSGQTNATAEDVDTYGFECYIDGGPSPVCATATDETLFFGNKSYFDLQPGPHYVIIQAFVDIGNQRYYDPEPPRFEWTILEEPLDTIITDATDGNEEFVENKSSTISNDINFTFIAENNTTNASFNCVLDNGPDEPCDVGFKFYGGLPSGEHTFSVNAYIPGGEGDVDTTPATWVWTVENIVVNTTLEPTFDGNGPLANRSSTTSNEIHFKFSGQTNATAEDVDTYGFECYIDGGPSPVCATATDETLFFGNKSYFDLQPGPHYVIIQAFVDIGNQRYYDPEPPRFEWTILEEPLDTIITDATDGNEEFVENKSSTTTSNDINFTFTAENNTTNASFNCVLDNGPDEPCDDGFIIYEGLENGEHTFRVNAYIPGGEGEVDTTPATWVWTIVEEAEPNTVIIVAIDGNTNTIPPGGSSTSGSMTFVFAAFAAGEEVEVDGFECQLDDGPIEDCDAGVQPYLDLLPGIHTFSVRFVDGETEDPTPATFTWAIIPDTVIESAVDGNGDDLID